MANEEENCGLTVANTLNNLIEPENDFELVNNHKDGYIKWENLILTSPSTGGNRGKSQGNIIAWHPGDNFSWYQLALTITSYLTNQQYSQPIVA